MLLEITYHLWSPRYRREDPIEDPLHVTSSDRDDQNLAAKLKKKIETHQREHQPQHNGRRFTWPLSTHKNLHGAAINGILAGENTVLPCGPISLFEATRDTWMVRFMSANLRTIASLAFRPLSPLFLEQGWWGLQQVSGSGVAVNFGCSSLCPG